MQGSWKSLNCREKDIFKLVQSGIRAFNQLNNFERCWSSCVGRLVREEIMEIQGLHFGAMPAVQQTLLPWKVRTCHGSLERHAHAARQGRCAPSSAGQQLKFARLPVQSIFESLDIAKKSQMTVMGYWARSREASHNESTVPRCGSDMSAFIPEHWPEG